MPPQSSKWPSGRFWPILLPEKHGCQRKSPDFGGLEAFLTLHTDPALAAATGYIRRNSDARRIRNMELAFDCAHSPRGIILNLRRREIASLPTPSLPTLNHSPASSLDGSGRSRCGPDSPRYQDRGVRRQRRSSDLAHGTADWRIE